MLKDEVMLISVLILQCVSLLLNVKKHIRSRCTSAVDIEKNIIREDNRGR